MFSSMDSSRGRACGRRGARVLGTLVRPREAVEPGEERLEQWSVENHGDTVELGERAHVEGTRDAAHDGRLLVSLVLEALLAMAARPPLENWTILELACRRLEAGVDDGGHGAVHRGDGVAVLAGVVEDSLVVLAGDDTLLQLGALRRRTRGGEGRRLCEKR